MVAYLDSSVVLRHILLGDLAIQRALECGSLVSSELMEIECRRVLQRCRMTGVLNDVTYVTAIARLNAVLEGVSLLSLSAAVKKRAMESFPVVIKTLDALHLATALVYKDTLLSEELVLFSHDDAMNRCAAVLGFVTLLG